MGPRIYWMNFTKILYDLLRIHHHAKGHRHDHACPQLINFGKVTWTIFCWEIHDSSRIPKEKIVKQDKFFFPGYPEARSALLAMHCLLTTPRFKKIRTCKASWAWTAQIHRWLDNMQQNDTYKIWDDIWYVFWFPIYFPIYKSCMTHDQTATRLHDPSKFWNSNDQLKSTSSKSSHMACHCMRMRTPGFAKKHQKIVFTPSLHVSHIFVSCAPWLCEIFFYRWCMFGNLGKTSCRELMRKGG